MLSYTAEGTKKTRYGDLGRSREVGKQQVEASRHQAIP